MNHVADSKPGGTPQRVHYDALIIGAGQAGGPLAGALAKAGQQVALIERKHVGGTCVNEGCTPTKAMAASARVAYLARRAADYGVHTGQVRVDLAQVRRRKQEIVETFRSGSQRSLDRENLTLIMGEGRFVGPKRVEVRRQDGELVTLSAERVFINTGARPSLPPIPGLERVSALDSSSVMELPELPEKLLVLGGGYVGLEFAQMFRRFGSEVSVIQRASQLLTREDQDVADEVSAILQEDGVRVHLSSEAVEVHRAEDGCIVLTLKEPAGKRQISGSHLLVAAGRRPNSDMLDLEAAGIRADERGFIEVNDRLETNVPGVYALGDVKGGAAFTHISFDDYRVVKENLLGSGGRSTRERLVPYTVFIDPQLGRVGLSEQQAKAQGYRIKVAKLPMRRVARGIELAETRGFMKAVVDADSGQILGATMLSIEGGELVGALQLAMMGKLPYTAIRDGVFAHPTLTESLNNLFSTLA